MDTFEIMCKVHLRELGNWLDVNGKQEEGIFIDSYISDMNIWVPFNRDRK